MDQASKNISSRQDFLTGKLRQPRGLLCSRHVITFASSFEFVRNVTPAASCQSQKGRETDHRSRDAGHIPQRSPSRLRCCHSNGRTWPLAPALSDGTSRETKGRRIDSSRVTRAWRISQTDKNKSSREQFRITSCCMVVSLKSSARPDKEAMVSGYRAPDL